jgi:23S rRNA (uracil1939-C5)-methyltransferase
MVPLREALHAPADLLVFCEALRAQIPELSGAGAELDPELNRRVRRRWAGLAWGKAGLHYEAADRSYWVGRGAFFQVNRFLVDRLVGLVSENLSGALAWDLFAGVGLFTLALAERFSRVVAVEAGDVAARDLRAASKGGAAFEAVQAPTLDFLRARELQRERPDAVVLDPPRAGLGVEASGILARLAVPRLVYVSCDPVTLARDLKILTASAYRMEQLDMIDLFPQTFHLETVVHLSRR